MKSYLKSAVADKLLRCPFPLLAHIQGRLYATISLGIKAATQTGRHRHTFSACPTRPGGLGKGERYVLRITVAIGASGFQRTAIPSEGSTAHDQAASERQIGCGRRSSRK